MAGTKEKSAGGSLVELVTIVAVALGLALGIQAFLVKPFRIPSESMVPTLEIGQRVLVDRVSFRFSDPDRGDIVVFKPPQRRRLQHLRSRARARLALPAADQGALRHELHQARGGRRRRPRSRSSTGRVYINGKRQKEPFVATSTPSAGSATCPRRSPSRKGTTS